HAVPAARIARLGYAMVAIKDKLGVQIQIPKGKLALQMRDDCGSRPDIKSLSSHEGADFTDWRARQWINGHGCSSCVIAVETLTCIDIVFCLFPRSENQAQFGLQEGGVGNAGVEGSVTPDIPMVGVSAEPRYAAEFIRPLETVLYIDAPASLDDMVLLCYGNLLSIHGMVKSDRIDIIIAHLHSYGIDHIVTGQRSYPI